MFFTLLIHMLNFVSIGYYLLYDLSDYNFCIILNYKNLQFKQLSKVITLLNIINVGGFHSLSPKLVGIVRFGSCTLAFASRICSIPRRGETPPTCAL